MMGGTGPDTTLGGMKRDFPSTCWSRVLFSGGDPARARSAAESLARAYWKPIYAYVRAKWSKSNDDAKDLTQDFFVWMMESGFAAKADPTRGRFRAFVKLALKSYLGGEDRKQHTLKRGGDREILKLDGAAGELEGIGIADPAGRSPDEVLDEAWRNELLARAAERLEETLRAEGKERYYRIFRDYHLTGAGEVSYREVAARHGVSEVDVSNHLMHAKRRFQAVLTDLVAETVQSEDELREELKALFGEDPR